MSLLFPEARVQRAHLEADLLHACMQYLARALPWDGIAHHSPGEGMRSLRAQRDLKRSGYVTGWPDIEIIWQSRAYFIELKTAHGQLSGAQQQTHRRLIDCGAPVLLCRSVPGVECALRELGLPLRARVAA